MRSSGSANKKKKIRGEGSNPGGVITGEGVVGVSDMLGGWTCTST